MLTAGDGDFLPTIESLQDRGLQVRVESRSHAVSRRLRDVANEFIEADRVRARGLRASVRAPEELAHHHQAPPARASRNRTPARPARADQHRSRTLTDDLRRRQPPTTSMSIPETDHTSPLNCYFRMNRAHWGLTALRSCPALWSPAVHADAVLIHGCSGQSGVSIRARAIQWPVVIPMQFAVGLRHAAHDTAASRVRAVATTASLPSIKSSMTSAGRPESTRS